jgi:hypothetical protein
VEIDLNIRRLQPDEVVDWKPPMITFRVISDDGRREDERPGPVWGPAPPWRGQRAWWVRQGCGSVPGWKIIRVVVTTRRHRCGRMDARGILRPSGGRYVDPGEAYSCPAVRLADALAREDHFRRLMVKVIPGGELTNEEFDRLSGVK